MDFSGILGGVVIVSLLAACDRTPGRSSDQDRRDGESPSQTAESEVERPVPETKKPNERFANGLEFPEDPTEAVAYLSANHVGRDLAGMFTTAGAHFGKLGPKEAQEFILALPPGVNGRSGMTAALRKLVEGHAPEMFEWLSENSSELGKDWTNTGFRVLLGTWAGNDFVEAASHLEASSHEKLGGFQKNFWMGLVLDWAKPEDDARLRTFIDSIRDDELRAAAWGSKPAIESRLRASPEDTVREIALIEDANLRMKSLTSLISVLPKFRERTLILNEWAAVDSPQMRLQLTLAASEWVRTDLNDALDWVSSLEDTALRDEIVAESWRNIANHDPDAAGKWVASISDDALRTRALNEFNSLSAKP